MLIGCHLSSTLGFAAMGRTAVSIGANTFQFFSRNPRGGRAKEIDIPGAQALCEICSENSFGTLIAHAPYTLNACAAQAHTREFAELCMREDLMRMEYLPHSYYNFHPGSHVGQGVSSGIELTSTLVNKLLSPEQTSTVLFETMAGQGSEIGATFEQIGALVDRILLKDHIGVCLDTCHVFAAGYDIKNDLDGVLTQFDKAVGLRYLKALHINDSVHPLGSHRDRHQRIGLGEIGLEAMRRIVRHDAFSNLPMILETPNELDGYAEEIRMLRSEDA